MSKKSPSIPKVQPLLIPVLKTVADGSEHASQDIRREVADQLKLTDEELKRIHPKSGINIWVNLIAFALVYLQAGKAIVKKREGVYQIAKRNRHPQ